VLAVLPGAGRFDCMKPEKVKFMLMAVDMKRAVAFYRDVIGLEEIFVSDFWTELRHGDAIIALHGGHDGSRNSTGLSFQYEDVLAMAERIAKAGAKILQSPQQREGEPILLGVFRDAEGNEVFITQYVG
jgi:predicted enzyme related to lactoylglutathione lyase